MTLNIITEFFIGWFSIYPNITLKYHTRSILKSFVKQNNDSNKAWRYFCEVLLYRSSFVSVLRFMSSLHKTIIWILTFSWLWRSYFFLFTKWLDSKSLVLTTSVSIQMFVVPSFAPTSEVPPFWNGWNYRIEKNMTWKSPSNASLPNWSS
jgi:hypothetical protein